MKRNKRLLSVSLALVMVLSLVSGMTMTASAFAEERQTKSNANTETVPKKTDMLLAVDEIIGISASSVDSLFSENQSISREATPKLSSLALAYEDGKLVFRGTLMHNSEVIAFVSSGNLYKNERTDNAAMYGNLILGDMSDFDNIHFVQFRIDKDKSSIIIILQTRDTKQLMQFQVPIDSDLFDVLYYSQKNQLSGTALEEKIIDLYNVVGNLIDKDSSASKSELISSSVPISGIQTMAASYNGWTDLIDDLNTNGSVTLGNYSNIDTSMFKGNGWLHDNKWGSTPYAFVSYSTPNGIGEYLTQFALVDIVTQSYSGTGDKWNASMQAMYNDGMIVRYESYSDTLTVLYYGWGIRFDNFKVGINGLTDDAIFIDRSVNRAYEASGSIVRAAIAVFSPLDTITSVFEYLLPYTDQSINNKVYFDDTYSAQYIRYNGKIIRGVAASTEDNLLSSSGHFVNVGGTIRYDTSTGTSWYFGYGYTGYSNL